MNAMPRFEALLFDLDGTLYDSAQLDRDSLTQLLEVDLGWDGDEFYVEEYLGVASRKVLEHIAPHRVDELLSKWLLYQDQLREQTKLFPSVRSTLKALKEAGYKLGIVTSQNESELKATRQHIKLDELFDVWVSASDTLHPKPHPAPVLKALQALDCRPERALFIGDSVTDIQAGRSAGTQVAAILWGVSDPETLIDTNPDLVFKQVLDLRTLMIK